MNKLQMEYDKLLEQKETMEGHLNSYIDENKKLHDRVAKSDKLSKAYSEHIKEIQKIFAKMPKLKNNIYLIRKADPKNRVKQLRAEVRDRDKWGKDYNEWILKLRSVIYGVVPEGDG